MFYIHNHNPVNIEWKLTGQLESFCFPNPLGPRRAEHHLLPPPTEAEPRPIRAKPGKSACGQGHGGLVEDKHFGDESIETMKSRVGHLLTVEQESSLTRS